MKRYYFFLSAFCMWACSNDSQQSAEEVPSAEYADSLVSVETVLYEYHKKFSPQELDTLLTNLTAYIFRKPVDAQWDTKFEPRFRPFFIENRINLELIYLHQNADSSFYYYLLRDAQQNINGSMKRGVLGKFDMDTNLVLSSFEEIANTPAASDEKLKEIGLLFMQEVIATGTIEKYLDDKTKIEWPDGRLFYSKEKYEWRYLE